MTCPAATPHNFISVWMRYNIPRWTLTILDELLLGSEVLFQERQVHNLFVEAADRKR